MLADKGYDSDWFRAALKRRGIVPCIPSRSNRRMPLGYDPNVYRLRHKIENMFGRLKDWRRIHTRYDRCAHTFMSASGSSRAPSSVGSAPSGRSTSFAMLLTPLWVLT